MRKQKHERRTARSDVEDVGTESPVTSMASPSSLDKEEIESKPVDMDVYCKNNNDDDDDGQEKANKRKIEPSDVDLHQGDTKELEMEYTSALTKTMYLKQTKITEAMEKILEDALNVAARGEHEKLSIEEMALLKEKAAINFRKQNQITKQIVDLIQQLEQEAMTKEATNQLLRKSLRKANRLLESEGFSMVESFVVPTGTMSHASRRGTRTMRPEMFSITEIFCNDPKEEEDLDDMTCQYSEAAHANGDNVKEPPLSPVSAKTVTTTSGSEPLESENELLEL